MDGSVRALSFVASLPPPPRPDSAGGDGSGTGLPLAVWLTMAAVVAFGVGLVAGRVLAARGRRAASAPSVYRIDLWRNGEATVLGYAAAADKGTALETHVAALRAKRVRGAVVLIEPVSDAIVALRCLTTEEPPWARPAARVWSGAPQPQPVAAAR